MIGARDSGIVTGTLASAGRHQVPYELLDADQVTRRFPAFSPLDDMVGVYEPGASVLRPERIVALQLELASRAGASLQFGEQALGWEPVPGGIELRTERNAWSARHLVCCAGPWTGALLSAAALPLTVERQVQTWWEPSRDPELFSSDRMPVSMWQLANGTVFYTMPNRGDGVKAGWHHNGPTVDPDTVDRDVTPAENASVADLLRRFVPHAKGQRLHQTVCLYTNTPDGHFIVDELPGHERVLVVSACSGHGFKFASVMGEIVADLVTTGRCAFDLAPFRLSRFSRPGTA